MKNKITQSDINAARTQFAKDTLLVESTREPLQKAAGPFQISSPMLARACSDIRFLGYPVLATPKLDGIRFLKLNGRALTRAFKPIRNDSVRKWIEVFMPDGVDGELMLRNGTFSETSSAIGRASGRPDFVCNVFDYVKPGTNKPYHFRMLDLSAIIISNRVNLVLPVRINNVLELEAYETKCLAEGYEGVMVRDPNSPYKCGRSTENEGYLLKIKRFSDSEAVIVGCSERMQNTNEAQQDTFGHSERSSCKDGMIGKGVIGSFACIDTKSGVAFSVAVNDTRTGVGAISMSSAEQVVGKTIKYKFQPAGVKTAPRFPTFLGFREAWDL